MKQRNTEIRLQWLVSGAIVLGMLCLAAIIIFHSRQSNRRILIDLAQKNAQQIAAKISSQIDQQTQPIIAAMHLLSHDELVRSHTHSARMARLPFLKIVLQSNPVLSSVYVGYQDGDFFLLRKLSSVRLQQRVQSPANARFMVQSIERRDNGHVQSAMWLFYDQGFNLIQRRMVADYRYDPRRRHWFTQADASGQLVIDEPYLFYTTQEVGVTLSLKSDPYDAVIGMDASIADLSNLMHHLQANQVNQIALVDEHHKVIAYSMVNKLIRQQPHGHLRLAQVEELQVPIFDLLIRSSGQVNPFNIYTTAQGRWFGQNLPVGPAGKNRWRLLYGVPESFLLRSADEVMETQLLWSAAIILLLLVLGWRVGALVVKPMQRLSAIMDSMRTFNFHENGVIHSHVKEVNTFSQLLHDMATVIQHFLSISLLLSQEKDLDKMLTGVVNELAAITSSRAASIYLYETNKHTLVKATPNGDWGPDTIVCDGSEAETIIACCRQHFSQPDTLVCTPLFNRRAQVIGVLILSLTHQDDFHNPGFMKFVKQLSSSAATAIETQKQVAAQSALIDAIIRLLADAIDAKSPYTGGHCERVPKLAEMIITAANQQQQGEFADFVMDDLQRQEFNIAAWLHDCGKITSREYVIDKATKLETLYNRIHEIRTRFEVVWRDAEIAYWQGIAQGQDPQVLAATRRQAQHELHASFALIAQLNVGSEAVQPADIAQLKHISEQTWVRHFSARIGLSRDEMARQHGEEMLPVTERLLDDKPEHLVPWGDNVPPVTAGHPDNRWGFDMTLPDNEMNRGEIYNLSIPYGTLTAEERFLVNDHIIQTIKMLSELPFPEEMRHVPDIAGNHHEKIDGTGYPRKRHGEQLSIAEKVMALADVFEALTAKDRPYKEAKTLSEALGILAKMVKGQHIDAQVFRLFMEQKIYQTYADQYLLEKQRDEVDRVAIMAAAGLDDTA